jgi:hypothetical protein
MQSPFLRHSVHSRCSLARTITERFNKDKGITQERLTGGGVDSIAITSSPSAGALFDEVPAVDDP